MKILLLLLLLLSSTVYASGKDTCELLEDTALWIMTERQQGKDIDQYLNTDQLNENQYLLLSDMIVNANQYPVFATDLMRQKAIDNFKKEWKEDCERSGLED